jgi:replicative DNA helicase
MSEQNIFDLQVLASAFRDAGAITEFAKELHPEDVGKVHGYTGIYEFYKALLAFHAKTSLDPVNPIAFKTWIESETDIQDALGGSIGVEEFIDTLMGIEISDYNSIIKLVQHRARKRRQLDSVQNLKELLSGPTLLDNDQIHKLTDEIKSLSQDIDYDPLASVRTSKDIINDVEKLWDIPPFLKTQFPSLNMALGYSEDGGFFRGGVHSIVGLSGMGKSTFVKCLCNNWLDEGYSVLFINFEEAQSHWERVLMTQIIKRNVYAEANKLTSGELSKLTQTFTDKLEEWGDRLMIRHDPDTLFFEDLERWLRDVLGHGARKPDVVVIDTIQSMFIKSGGKARWGEFEQIMVGLEKLAKDMDAVFIITAQQNINSTKEKREKLDQSDMGGSVTITQKSTIALFLTPQKDAMDDDTIDERLMQTQIVKNRITGTEYADTPPVIRYIDNIKSYVAYVPEKEDIRYNMEFVELEDLGSIV